MEIVLWWLLQQRCYNRFLCRPPVNIYSLYTIRYAVMTNKRFLNLGS